MLRVSFRPSRNRPLFGLFWLLGYQLSPRLADIGDARFWRIDKTADYALLNGLARNRINLDWTCAGFVPVN
ncbi:Tn3 family transposase [Neokomagataea sp. TBRC 2177]|uniref:Tn3 family transposase n=1 Tax=Neokomagataea anthophila TaxID=2826925 RepID=A0ABS5E9Y6_9PROT|nr:Tn3 family transposase [Neokomagataea anthophila]